MGTNQKLKTQFRKTAKWKKFRAYMKKLCGGVDFITNKKLLKGFQLHHKDMRVENYERLRYYTHPEMECCYTTKGHP